MYYYVDKYNVMRRRTIKESISYEVSVEMIEMLELTIIFFAVGNFTFSYHLFHKIEWQEYVIIIIGVIYSILPMEQINQHFFKVLEVDEILNYD